MNAKVVSGVTLTLSSAMYAAVRDSLGLVPLPADADGAYDKDRMAAIVVEGIKALEATGLVTESDGVFVIEQIVQDVVRTTLDPEVILRFVCTHRDEVPAMTSVFSRHGLAPVAFSGTNADGVRSYSVGDWITFIDHVVEPFEGVASGQTEMTEVPTSEAVSWVEGLTGPEHPSAVTSTIGGLMPIPSHVDVVANIAVVATSDRAVTDGRNAALIRAGGQAWLVEPRVDDPQTSLVSAVNSSSIREWVTSALSELAEADQ